MYSGYAYLQFGMWWVFIEATRGPIYLCGPYRTREVAEVALQDLLSHASRNTKAAAVFPRDNSSIRPTPDRVAQST